MEETQKKHAYLEVFFIALFISASFLLPYIIYDKGLFLFFGDYDVQQIPFYMLAHNAIRSGNIAWSWTTDLGSSFISSYSFYLLGSPFFWLTVPLPAAAVPYTLGPLLALKISFAAVVAYAYIRRFVRHSDIAAIGGLLYAFSSFSIYNIFFNHFHEPMLFFPLMLIALEEYMQNDRKSIFAVTVFINALVNYIFFVGEVIFLVIYFVLRVCTGEWKLSFKKMLFLAFETVVGFAMSFILLMPSVLEIILNYRTTQHLTGWGLLLYDNNQRIPDILHSLFFPQDIPSRPNFFPDANNKWASIAAWLPLFSLSGALSFIIAKKHHWVKRILCVSLVMALIPGLNSLFVLLNSEYYARWFYMPVLFLCLATAMALDDESVDFRPGIFWTAFITLAFALTVGLIPQVENGKIKAIGLELYPLRFWVYVLISLGGLLVVWLLVTKFRKDSYAFINAATIALTVTVCIYANFFIATGKEYGYDGTWYHNVAINGAKQLKLDRSQFMRVDVLNGMDNQAMFWQIPTINAFQSVVPASIMSFYQSLDVARDVASRPDISLAGIRPLLSVKYLFDSDHSAKLSAPGWSHDSDQLGFKVWKDDNYIPMGFTFDHYVTQGQYKLSLYRDRLLLKAILLTPQQIKQYGSLLSPIMSEESLDYSDTAMSTDCKARAAASCSSFTTDNSGFSAHIDLDRANLVFFSVPYDTGWSATVDGRSAAIENVDVGFMAVLCPKGSSIIRFTYQTPGLTWSIGVTLDAAALLALYTFLWIYHGRKKRRLAAAESRLAGEDASEVSSSSAKEDPLIGDLSSDDMEAPSVQPSLPEEGLNENKEEHNQ